MTDYDGIIPERFLLELRKFVYDDVGGMNILHMYPNCLSLASLLRLDARGLVRSHDERRSKAVEGGETEEYRRCIRRLCQEEYLCCAMCLIHQWVVRSAGG